jgi:hypothetical protein
LIRLDRAKSSEKETKDWSDSTKISGDTDGTEPMSAVGA